MLKKFLAKNWLLLLILLIASFCRLYRISEYMEFLGDQGRDVLILRDFLKHGDLFFIGPQTSIGNMYLGPWFYYLIAPFLLLSNYNPVGPAIFIALLSILTVWLVFYVGKKWFDPKTAYIAAFLYAISPVVIKYSNFIWNPNVMPLFSLLFIYWLTEKRYLLASLAFVMCLNSHYLALLLLPLAFLIWLRNSPKKYIKETLLAILIFILSLTPQILFDLKHQGQNLNALITFFTQRETTVNLKAYKSLPLIPSLFNQINTDLLAGKDITFGIIVSIILFLGIIYLLLRHLSEKLYLCLLWYLTALIGLGLYKQHIYSHYFSFLFPVVFILMAYLISKLPKLFALILFLSLTFFSLLQNPFRWAPNRQMQNAQKVSDYIITQSQGQPFNYALISKMGYAYPYYLVENKNYFDIKDKVTEQLFVVCVPFQIECNPINNPEYGIAAFGWAKIDQEAEINGIKIYRLVPNPSGQK